MFSMCSELTPRRAPIPDGRMEQIMQPYQGRAAETLGGEQGGMMSSSLLQYFVLLILSMRK